MAKLLSMKALYTLMLVFIFAACAPQAEPQRLHPRHKQQGPLLITEKSCQFKGVRALVERVHFEKHFLRVTVDEIESAQSKVYELETEPPTHTHQVRLSSDDFDRLSQNEDIEVWTSDSLGHRHLVRLECL